MRIFLLGMIVFLLHGINAKAGGIRTLNVNDDKMQVIFLRMGKASVLRFPEKPKKVVIGNQNYYSIEFIENDSGEEDYSKNPFVIAFNAGYLLDCVSQIDTDEVLFSFSSPSKATIAHPSEQEENENFMELVMPVRIG